MLSSCSVLKNKNDCELLPLSNTIYGSSVNQKEFHQKERYIPCVVEKLMFENDDCSLSYNNKFRETADILYVNYHIYGCADTLWAKRKMADHIIEKYNIIQYDSTYMDTVLLLTVVDENKLPIDSTGRWGAGNFRPEGQQGYKYCESCKWDGKIFLPPEYRSKNRSLTIVAERRKGKYTVRAPYDIVDVYGLEGYSDYLLDNYGVTLTIFRIDQVSRRVYDYRSRK